MPADQSCKAEIVTALMEPLAAVPGVASVTVVGSLADRPDTDGISDMDVVVVCDTLSKQVFDECVGAASAIPAGSLGFAGKRVVVNSSFGPIKYDADDVVVVHLMVYDRAGHRQHVLKSPFTCYDWERSRVHGGQHLSQIYPVLRLQPRDFIEARRGMQDYLEDLNRGCLSYRRYVFGEKNVTEVVESMPLNARHRGEYAFHIVRNLVANYCKLMLQENVFMSSRELVTNWRRFLPGLTDFVPLYEELAANRRRHLFPDSVVSGVREFVVSFEREFNLAWSAAPRMVFIRHDRTSLNDGTFLGQRRDPPLERDARIVPLSCHVDRVFSSPLRRSLQTARNLVPGLSPVEDQRLSEIDYGEAEGMTFPQLGRAFPSVTDGWSRGEDASFPGGENAERVSRRIRAFVNDCARNPGTSLVVTHNVVLRCLVGWLCGVPAPQWHRIGIPHLEPLEVIVMNGRPYPNFSSEFKAAVSDSLTAFAGEDVHV